MTEATIHKIHDQFNTIVKLAQKLENMPRKFGTDEPLTATEIHLVEIIGDNSENLSVTDLSNVLGVTKGAISQNLKRLEKKQLILKQEDPYNVSRSIVKLTSKGKTAYYAHRHWHETMDGGFKAYFIKLDQDRIDFLIEFMSRVEDFLKRTLQ